jgi:hypothetical protein
MSWASLKDGSPSSPERTAALASDTATARTDFFATHRGRADKGMNIHYNAAGAFHDDLVRTDHGWRIKFRRLEVYFGDPLQVANPATNTAAAST